MVLRMVMRAVAMRDTITTVAAVMVVTVLVSTAARLGMLILSSVGLMQLTFLSQYSHSKADCTAPRKMGPCFNCGQEG